MTFEGLGGLGWERPGLGLAMSLFMFGFIGLPPQGLFGKFYAFSAAVDRGWTWLAIVGVVATVVSIYYYVGVVGAMYFRHPVEVRVAPAGGSPPRDWALSTAVVGAVIVTIGTFFAAGPLLDIARDSVEFLGFPTDERPRGGAGRGVAGEAFVAALRRLDEDVRMTLVEHELVGGECSYWACIPSKTLLRPLEVLLAAAGRPASPRRSTPCRCSSGETKCPGRTTPAR